MTYSEKDESFIRWESIFKPSPETKHVDLIMLPLSTYTTHSKVHAGFLIIQT